MPAERGALAHAQGTSLWRSGINFHVLDDNSNAENVDTSLQQGGVEDTKGYFSPRPAWLEAALAARKKTGDSENFDGAAYGTERADKDVEVRSQGRNVDKEENEKMCHEAPAQERAEQTAKVESLSSFNIERKLGGQAYKADVCSRTSLVERLAQRERELNLTQEQNMGDECAEREIMWEEVYSLQPAAPSLRALELCGRSTVFSWLLSGDTSNRHLFCQSLCRRFRDITESKSWLFSRHLSVASFYLDT